MRETLLSFVGIRTTVALVVIALLAACGQQASPETDREGLAALYHATDGPNWLRSANWLTDAPLDNWYGVSTDEEGRVTELELPANELSGAIPPELGNLDRLSVLDLTASRTMTTVSIKIGARQSDDCNNWSAEDFARATEEERDRCIEQMSGRDNRDPISRAIEQMAEQASDPENTRVDRNFLSGCIPNSLREQLDLEASDLGGLPFCEAIDVLNDEAHDAVPFTDADYMIQSCGDGDWGFGMGLEESDNGMVQCLINELEGHNQAPKVYADLLHAAILSVNLPAVQMLLEAGADPNGVQEHVGGAGILNWALISIESDSRWDEKTKETRELTSSERNNAVFIAELLVKEGARITRDNADDYKDVWFRSVGHGSVNIVRIMIAAGMDVNARQALEVAQGYFQPPITALVPAVKVACGRGEMEERLPGAKIVRMLVEAGADVNTMSFGARLGGREGKVIGIYESETVLAIAQNRSRQSCPEVVRLLKDAGASEELEGRRLEWGDGQPPVGELFTR